MDKLVNRNTTCPFLLRVFCTQDPLHTLRHLGDSQADDEVRLYTWLDASLRELVDLLKAYLPSARRTDFRISFVRPNLQGGLEEKEVGKVHSMRKTTLDSDTLQTLRFVIGDYIVVKPLDN
jgi:histone deacetylase complex subunit SAP18